LHCLNTGINRQQYIDKLDDYFSNYIINGGKYEKNLPNIFNILIENGDMSKAIKYSKQSICCLLVKKFGLQNGCRK